FYETDYRSESYKQAAKAEQDSGVGKNGASDKRGTNGTPAPKSEPAGGKKAKAGGKRTKSAAGGSDGKGTLPDLSAADARPGCAGMAAVSLLQPEVQARGPGPLVGRRVSSPSGN